MRFLTVFVLFCSLSASAFAGEEARSGQFQNLARQAEKVFVGKVTGIEKKDDIKIVSILVLEAWNGASQNETVKVFVMDRVVHNGDPCDAPADSEILFYLRRCPDREPYNQLGATLFLPVAGEAAVIPLIGAEGVEIRRVARRDLVPNAATLNDLENELQNISERVRANALSSLSRLSVEVLRAESGRLVEFVRRENQSALAAQALVLLAKISDSDSVSGLVQFAMEDDKSVQLMPLVAHTLNQIDPNAAVREVQSLSIQADDSKREIHAAALLARIDSPDALGELLVRAKKTRTNNLGRAFSSVKVGGQTNEIRDVFLTGTLDEKKASAYSMVRWGRAEDLQFLKQQVEQTKDAELKQFLQRLLKQPYLSFGEIR